MQNGVVSGNYFSGAGFSSSGLHPDAIWVGATTGPVTISNNFIDETYAAGATGVNNGMGNSAVRITSELGNTSNVSVTGNVLLGGTYTVDPGIGGTGTFSNINVSRNFIGFGQYGALNPGAAPATTESGNVIFDFTNPAYSAQAWTAYQAAGVPTAHLIVSSGGTIVAGSGSTTLYGAGARAHLFGGVGENNFVGGFGTQYLFGGPGANIFTELAISDSPVTGQDDIAYFDSAKDVIDLSHIDSNLTTPGVQNFTFIGTAAFSGGGAQVRYQQDPAHNATYVQAELAGNSSPDLVIRISGLQTLTAGNFALTAAQSTTDLANGAALAISETRAAGGGAEYFYSNVKGKPYTSFEAFYAGAPDVADDLNLSTAANEIDLRGANLTLTRGAGTETLQAGTNVFSLGYHATETIDASAAGAETFRFTAGFGHETIKGLTLSGATADTVQFATSSFSYLSAGMTQAQDLAAVLAHAYESPSGMIITDSHNDSLTLPGLTASSITAASSHFHFA